MEPRRKWNRAKITCTRVTSVRAEVRERDRCNRGERDSGEATSRAHSDTVRHRSRLARNCRPRVNAILDRPFEPEGLAQVLPSPFLTPTAGRVAPCSLRTLATFDLSTRNPSRTCPAAGSGQSNFFPSRSGPRPPATPSAPIVSLLIGRLVSSNCRCVRDIPRGPLSDLARSMCAVLFMIIKRILRRVMDWCV